MKRSCDTCIRGPSSEPILGMCHTCGDDLVNYIPLSAEPEEDEVTETIAEYETRVLSVIVTPKGGSIFDALATTVSIDDEGAGEFVKISQQGREIDAREIAIEVREWPEIKAAIDQMIQFCRK